MEQRTINLVNRTLNHRLTIETNRWLTIPISRDTNLCHLCSYNAVDNEAYVVLECPLYNPKEDKFPSLFENVALGSLKCIFQLDHQVDITLYLMETTACRDAKELASLKPS